MTPIIEVVKNPSGMDSLSNYVGETDFGDFDAFLTRNRDSDALTESNWRCGLKELGDEGENVVIHRFGHWACGWYEVLVVKRGTLEHTKAEEMTKKLKGYPVLDEDDFSRLESEEADRVWKDCYDVKERIAYIRDNESQFDFGSFEDMLSCVRGNYFAGYHR